MMYQYHQCSYYKRFCISVEDQYNLQKTNVFGFICFMFLFPIGYIWLVDWLKLTMLGSNVYFQIAFKMESYLVPNYFGDNTSSG